MAQQESRRATETEGLINRVVYDSLLPCEATEPQLAEVRPGAAALQLQCHGQHVGGSVN